VGGFTTNSNLIGKRRREEEEEDKIGKIQINKSPSQKKQQITLLSGSK
jgi:hypothetical protein